MTESCAYALSFKIDTLSQFPSSLSMDTRHYLSALNRLRASLALLPTSLPSGSSIYEFTNWTPDPELLDMYGAECSVLNANLEIVFGLRARAPLVFQERGPGIESLVNLFEKYLLGEYLEQPVIVKWVEDLTEAAERMAKAAPSQASNDCLVLNAITLT